jgi:hypothetical protein
MFARRCQSSTEHAGGLSFPPVNNLVSDARRHADAQRKLHMKSPLPVWQRLLITIIAMIVVSLAAGWLWQSVVGVPLPSYAGGLIGGLTALPIWELMKKFRKKDKSA